MRRSTAGSRSSSRCARRGRRRRRGSGAPATPSRSNWSAPRRAWRPGRPACSTMRRKARRACSAAASSSARARLTPSRSGAKRRAWWRRAGDVATSGKSRRGLDPGWIPVFRFEWGVMGADLDRATIAKAYARWAPVYDFVFGAVFERGRNAATAAAERIGGRILEVGVGTGLSLPDYAQTNGVIGIDISEPMLRKARARVAAEGLDQIGRAA